MSPMQPELHLCSGDVAVHSLSMVKGFRERTWKESVKYLSYGQCSMNGSDAILLLRYTRTDSAESLCCLKPDSPASVSLGLGTRTLYLPPSTVQVAKSGGCFGLPE